ncbi:helix-turn-helix domain-containing protein [Phytohabitans kaempferiae]|uniref:Helix-turn-helix domain-containing protein n=1 Tax=Phytohabitans kaempferiae TaxID=1620943 RepID=A0ABV6LV37_9ACTN
MTVAPRRTTTGKQADPAQKLTIELAAQLRDLRRRTGKSLRELERSTLSSDSSLSRYLAGRALPPWQVVAVLCEEGGGDSARLHDLWSRARQARATARIGDQPPPGEQSLQSTVVSKVGVRRLPLRWLVAVAAVAGVVGLLARRRLARA